jgi:hypothetical protein
LLGAGLPAFVLCPLVLSAVRDLADAVFLRTEDFVPAVLRVADFLDVAAFPLTVAFVLPAAELLGAGFLAVVFFTDVFFLAAGFLTAVFLVEVFFAVDFLFADLPVAAFLRAVLLRAAALLAIVLRATLFPAREFLTGVLFVPDDAELSAPLLCVFPRAEEPPAETRWVELFDRPPPDLFAALMGAGR